MTEDLAGNGRSHFEEALAEVLWLESRGWRLGVDGSWRHPYRAPASGLTHSQAFAMESRRRGAPDDGDSVPAG
jgi:hypothetical protein